MMSGVLTFFACATGELRVYAAHCSHGPPVNRPWLLSKIAPFVPPRVLVDDRIHADHVRQRRAGNRGGEDVRLRDRERRLIAAPRVAVQPDALRIDDAGLDRRLHGGHERPHGRHARIVHVVLDVRLQHRVAVARVRLPAEPVRASAGRNWLCPCVSRS